MNIDDFRTWLKKNNTNNKVISDTISRLKRLELTIGNTIESEYQRDKCESLMLSFKKAGKNDIAKSYQDNVILKQNFMVLNI